MKDMKPKWNIETGVYEVFFFGEMHTFDYYNECLDFMFRDPESYELYIDTN